MTRRIVLGLLTIAATATAGCSADAPITEKKPHYTFGVTPDGRVDVTAAEAWPDRNSEPPPLTNQELAEAFETLAACHVSLSSGPGLSWTLSSSNPISADEERVIPYDSVDGFTEYSQPVAERVSFILREALASHGDCASIEITPVTNLDCQEDGCASNLASPVVYCEGDIATVHAGTTFVLRDCSRSYTHCDPSSPTWCTDRHPMSCDPSGIDRCDGNVKLGCDSTGHVSFHDCAVQSGTCIETSDGARCDYGASCLNVSRCQDGKLLECVRGEDVVVDCDALGFPGCPDGYALCGATPQSP